MVVPDDGLVLTELVVEFVLSVGKEISLIAHGGHVTLSTVGLSSLIILPQVRVESTLTMGWTVGAAQATRIVGNVRVTTTAVVHIDNRLGVDVSHVVGRALLQELEGTWE